MLCVNELRWRQARLAPARTYPRRVKRTWFLPLAFEASKPNDAPPRSITQKTELGHPSEHPTTLNQDNSVMQDSQTQRNATERNATQRLLVPVMVSMEC